MCASGAGLWGQWEGLRAFAGGEDGGGLYPEVRFGFLGSLGAGTETKRPGLELRLQQLVDGRERGDWERKASGPGESWCALEKAENCPSGEGACMYRQLGSERARFGSELHGFGLDAAILRRLLHI